MILNRKFYARDARIVAKELLGKILVNKKERIGGIIVETEAYLGEEDPASRAFGGKKNMNSVMWESPGTIFIYMVHSNWLMNVVTGKKNSPEAVLIRALEPKIGIERMIDNRKKEELRDLTNGPGKLTQALKIDKRYNLKKVYDKNCDINILDNKVSFEIGTSHRIGVRKDLNENMRFFIIGNKYVSRSSSLHRRKG